MIFVIGESNELVDLSYTKCLMGKKTCKHSLERPTNRHGILSMLRLLIKIWKLANIFSTIFKYWSQYAKKVLTGVSQHVATVDQAGELWSWHNKKILTGVFHNVKTLDQVVKLYLEIGLAMPGFEALDQFVEHDLKCGLNMLRKS